MILIQGLILNHWYEVRTTNMQPIKAQWIKNSELASDISQSYNIILSVKDWFGQYVTNKCCATVEFALTDSRSTGNPAYQA